jgi:hypothetical protein
MTNGQSPSLSLCQAPGWRPRRDFCYCHTIAGLPMWGTLSDERAGLSFTTAAGLASAVILGSQSWGTHDFTVSDSRLPQPGGSCPHIYTHQEMVGPVISCSHLSCWSFLHSVSKDCIENTTSSSSIVACIFCCHGSSLPSHCQEMANSSGSAISPFRHHVTVWKKLSVQHGCQ